MPENAPAPKNAPDIPAAAVTSLDKLTAAVEALTKEVRALREEAKDLTQALGRAK